MTAVALTLAEVRKLPAFVRRDFLVAWSYRMAFISDALGLLGQALVFYFIGQLVDSSQLPRFHGNEVTYLEFAAVGMLLGAFIHFGLERVAAAVRSEQLMGTLESLLITPTAALTVQVGSVAFLLLYIPIRMAVFLGALALAFGLHFEPSGVAPAAFVMIAFMPFVWGLGVLSAAAILTFRRGSGLVGMGALVLALFSGLYFPIELLPNWIVAIAEHNPIAVAVDGMRNALLGGASWEETLSDTVLLAPMSLVALALGAVAFRAATARERRNGSLGLY